MHPRLYSVLTVGEILKSPRALPLSCALPSVHPPLASFRPSILSTGNRANVKISEDQVVRGMCLGIVGAYSHGVVLGGPRHLHSLHVPSTAGKHLYYISRLKVPWHMPVLFSPALYSHYQDQGLQVTSCDSIFCVDSRQSELLIQRRWYNTVQPSVR